MANPEHLKILKQGVEAWNRWRKENPENWVDRREATSKEIDVTGAYPFGPNTPEAYLIQTDLSKADLTGVNLNQADLSKANLTEVDLSKANLTGANFSWTWLSRANLAGAELTGASLNDANLTEGNLTGAWLSGADLTGAELSRASLNDANLTGANLRGANLSGTWLFRANLTGADLFGTNLQIAELGHTLLAYNDLRNVINLEKAYHSGPSYIDISTIIRSRGNIPESFLRGCGLPENFIQYIPSLVDQPIQFYSCFISYSSKDQNFAERLYVDLQNKGVRCWYAPKDMKIGDKIRDRIDKSIQTHDKLLLVLSENSIISEWVEDEVESAYEKEQNQGTTVLFPIRLDDAMLETEKAWAAKLRRSRHIGDFTNWKDHDFYQNAFDRLLKDLKAEK